MAFAAYYSKEKNHPNAFQAISLLSIGVFVIAVEWIDCLHSRILHRL